MYNEKYHFYGAKLAKTGTNPLTLVSYLYEDIID
jgi:hypothetical protein